jgi:hypothetical protein
MVVVPLIIVAGFTTPEDEIVLVIETFLPAIATLTIA